MAVHPQGVDLRLAQLSDLAAIMELLGRVVTRMQAAGNHQWNAEYPNEATFTRDMELGQLWVAETESGAVAGVAAITTDQQPEYADAGLDIHETAIVVHRLVVDPAQRGAGIATVLMRHAEAIARERGILILRLDTNTQNFAAQRFFVGLGYVLAGEVSFAGRTGLRFLCYEKRIEL
ncbi:MAG TPA: GNAT family N-acetyltransferase [Acidobacteriaceae bacterium]